MRENKHFETLNQLNRLLNKTIHYFKAFGISNADDAYWSKLCKCNKKLNMHTN